MRLNEILKCRERQYSDELRNLLIKWAVEWVSELVSSVAHANVLMKIQEITFWRPNLTQIFLSFGVASAMQQLTIKMTLRHNFISILDCVDVSLSSGFVQK